MTEKFKEIPVEEDTQIIFNTEAKIAEYDVVYQKWTWGGIHAESIIFCNEDVASLNEGQVKNEVLKCTALIKEGSQMTYKKGEKYTFVNFNFVTV